MNGGVTLVDPETGEVVAISQGEALRITAKIKGYVSSAWRLLVEAHERKAHLALGHPTWEAYCRAEFDISRSRSYELLDLGKVVGELEGAGVSGIPDTLNAEHARELKKAPTPEAKAEAWDAANAATGGKPTAAAIRDAIEPPSPTPESEPAPSPVASHDPTLVLIANFSKAFANASSRLAPFDFTEVVDAYVSEGKADEIERAAGDIRRWADAIDAARKPHSQLRSVR